MSTTGVTVYEHYCSHDGFFYSVFVDIEHECEDEVELVSCENDCCVIEVGDQHGDCCSDDIHHYQLDSDIVAHDGKVEVNLPLCAIAEFSFIDLEFVEAEKPTPVANSPPKTLLVTERLSQLQRYLL